MCHNELILVLYKYQVLDDENNEHTPATNGKNPMLCRWPGMVHKSESSADLVIFRNFDDYHFCTLTLHLI